MTLPALSVRIPCFDFLDFFMGDEKNGMIFVAFDLRARASGWYDAPYPDEK
jgi:hypothetical protein